MVLGYICQEHGYQDKCDNDAGQRICQECGNDVTGLTGQTRGRKAPPEDEPMSQSGDIQWTVVAGTVHRVYAFDFIGAVGKVVDKLDDPQRIREVFPTNRHYRR